MTAASCFHQHYRLFPEDDYSHLHSIKPDIMCTSDLGLQDSRGPKDDEF